MDYFQMPRYSYNILANQHYHHYMKMLTLLYAIETRELFRLLQIIILVILFCLNCSIITSCILQTPALNPLYASSKYISLLDCQSYYNK